MWGKRNRTTGDPGHGTLLEESSANYGLLFQELKESGLEGVEFIVSDLVKAIAESFPGTAFF